jgi:hypothetical protein
MAGASIDEVFLCTVGKQGPTLLGRRVPIFVSHDDVFFDTLGTIHILREHVLVFFALYDIIIGAINLHAR